MWKVGNVVTDVPLGSDFIGYGFNVMTEQGKQLMVFAYETQDAAEDAARHIEAAVELGRVDGFNQDEAECKGYEGSVVLRGLLASERDAFEALEFADGLLDACPRLVEYFRKECRSIDRV